MEKITNSKMNFVSNTPPAIYINENVVPIETCVLMKVGSHGDESFKEIIERKLREQEKCGFMLWGYSGNLMDAFMTRNHLKSKWKNGKKPVILMIETKSPFRNSPIKSTVFSLDKRYWHKLPENAFTTGCDKAIICKGLKEVNFQLNLVSYKVSVGLSKGRILNDYMKHRTDKACAEFFDPPEYTKADFVTVNWIAEIIPPFAVYLKDRAPAQRTLFNKIVDKTEFGLLSPNPIC